MLHAVVFFVRSVIIAMGLGLSSNAAMATEWFYGTWLYDDEKTRLYHEKNSPAYIMGPYVLAHVIRTYDDKNITLINDDKTLRVPYTLGQVDDNTATLLGDAALATVLTVTKVVIHREGDYLYEELISQSPGGQTKHVARLYFEKITYPVNNPLSHWIYGSWKYDRDKSNANTSPLLEQATMEINEGSTMFRVNEKEALIAHQPILLNENKAVFFLDPKMRKHSTNVGVYYRDGPEIFVYDDADFSRKTYFKRVELNTRSE